MNCKEFRNALNNDNSSNAQSLNKHLDKCKECSFWLDQKLEIKPKEISNAKLESPTLKCMPDISKLVVEDKKEDGLLAMYMSGLKYGLTFGLSVVIAISIFGPTKNTNSNAIKTVNSISFVSNTTEIPSFLDKDDGDEKNEDFFVTTLETGNSQLVSFVDDETIPSFDEENMEELLWLENQSG